MYREVSDLSFGSISEDEDPVKASPLSGVSNEYESALGSSWKTYTNNLDQEAEVEVLVEDDMVQESAASAGRLPSTRGTVRFNTTFEPSQDVDQEPVQLDLPATWAACDMTDLALVAAHLASAAMPAVQQSANDQYAADAILLHSASQTEDMLGFGTLDLRSCTLNRRAAAFAATQRLGMHASFSNSVQVIRACLHAIGAEVSCTADAVHCLQNVSMLCRRLATMLWWPEHQACSDMAALLESNCKHWHLALACLSLEV